MPDQRDSRKCAPLENIEIIVNGEIVKRLKPNNRKTPNGAYTSGIEETVELDGSSWVAVRCFGKRPKNKFRYAHTAPVHFDVTGHPLRPRRAEVQYLIARMEEELVRNKNVLQAEQLSEYRKALAVYKRIAKTAR